MTKKSKNSSLFSLVDSETANRLFDILPDAVIIHNGEEILFCNPAAVKMYRAKNLNALIGTQPDKLVHPEQLAWLRERRKTTSKPGGKGLPQVTQRVRLDGTTFFAENTSVGIQYDNQSAFMILSRDVSEYRAAEHALKLSEDRYENVINSQSELITVFNVDGNFTPVNEAYCRFTGRTREDLLGSSLYDPVPEHELEDLKNYFASFTPAEQYKIVENQISSADGELHDFEWSNSASFDENGDITEIQSVGRDVTKQREVDRLKSEFIAVVSHELRTPLTSIMGALGLTLGGVLGELPEKATEMLTVAKLNSEKLIGLINDILDFEKLQSGAMEYNMTKVDMVALVKQAIEINQSYADQFGVSFNVEKKGKKIFVRADEARIGQVISNLLSNAAKFSQTGDVVDIAVKDKKHCVRVEVKDSGPGIAEEFRKSIFDRFSQADSTDIRKVQGTGLGLSISKSIIDQHDGKIDFKSRKGKGTTFFFELAKA